MILACSLPPPRTGAEILASLVLQAPWGGRFAVEAPFPSRARLAKEKGAFSLRNVIGTLGDAGRLCRALRRPGPKIVLTNLSQNAAGLLRHGLFVRLAKLHRAPVAAHSLGDGFHRFYAAAPAWLRAWARWVLRGIDRIVLPAPGLAAQYDGLGVERALCRARTGVAGPGGVRRSRSGEEPLRVCFIGFLTRAKGALDLLRAAVEILRERPHVAFHLITQEIARERNITYLGTAADNTREAARLLQEVSDPARIVLHSPRTDAEKWRILVDADLFTLPSHSEAVPLSLLEALACGLPAVVTPVGGIPETVREGTNALFVPPGDAGRLKEALLRLIDDPSLRRRMGEANRRLYEERYTLACYAAELRAVFESMRPGVRDDETVVGR